MYDRQDACVIASTGFGKSLIYQFPAVFLNKLVVVISPLIALMQDQVLSLQSKGVKACFFGSQQPDKSLRMQDHQIVYITPEFLLGNGKLDLAEVYQKLLLFAVDEAHVLFQWSDFRPKLKQVGIIRELFPNIPIVALTATAPLYVQNHFTSLLKLRQFAYVKTALDRPNLEFEVRGKNIMDNNYMLEVLPLLQGVTEGSAIVYCLSRELAEDMSERFREAGIDCRPYHAKLDICFRQQVVKDFRSNKIRFVICTIAFGMGIDKADVRLVVHYGVSKSIEAYYQEAGRAGRDGKLAKCILFHSQGDYWTLRSFIRRNQEKASKEQQQQQYGLLDRMEEFVASKQCRRVFMLNYLGTSKEELKKITIRDDCCDNCRKDLKYNIPPQLQYHGLNEDGTFDFTNDARILLNAWHKNLAHHEIVDLLLGEMPTTDNYRFYKLQCLRSGRNKATTLTSELQRWWLSTISLLQNHKFVTIMDMRVILKSSAKEFLRFKTTKMILKPLTGHLTSCFKKKENVEFFWEDGVIKSRPKLEEEDEDEDWDMIIQTIDRTASDQEMIDSGVDDDDDFLLEAVERIEREEALKLSHQHSQQEPASKTQMEIDSLQFVNFDEEFEIGESSKKRCCDDDQDEKVKKMRKKF